MKFVIHPVSVIVWLWLFFVLGAAQAVSYFFAITLHELAHFLVAKKLGYKLSRFSLSPYGVELAYFQKGMDCKHEIAIALAGPLVNLATAFLVVAVWWLLPEAYFFTEAFVMISVLLALINLLPAYPLDGGRIFVGLTSHFLSEKKAKKITMFVNLFLCIFFFCVFAVLCFVNFNPTCFLFSFFLAVGILDLRFQTKFEKVNIFQKDVKNFVVPVFYYVNLDVTIRQLLSKISSSKTHIFCVVLENGKVVNLSEKLVINLSLKYDLNTKLCEIIK